MALLSVSTPGAIKFGVKVRDERKDFTAANTRFNAIADYPLTGAGNGWILGSEFLQQRHQCLFARSRAGRQHDARPEKRIRGFIDGTDSLDNLIGSFSGAEKVYAGYVMNSVDLGRLRINVGLRVENTHVNYTGHQEGTDTTSGNTSVSTVSGKSTYTDLFPSVQLRYSLGSVTNLRAAVTRAIARPNYYDLAPHISGETCGGVVQHLANAASAGNPDLQPQHAWNYDLLFEHYLPAAGIVSARRVLQADQRFPVRQDLDLQRSATQFDGNYVSMPVNGGNGHLTGIEADYAQHSTFLPGVWQGLGFDANWTHVWSRGTCSRMRRTMSTSARLLLVPSRCRGSRRTSRTSRSCTTASASPCVPPGSTRARTS